MQMHLHKEAMINLGSFYTPRFIVEIVYQMLEQRLKLNNFLLFDSACGYGDFFIKDYLYLGADIDDIALQKVVVKTMHTNSLSNVSRAKFGIDENQSLIIIGNPPYNDKTSILKNNIKQNIFEIDSDLEHRDLGISFLRSYELLNPDYICILHPLSYLIKRANFNALARFKESYRLRDSMIISSYFFTPKSSSFFPIIIALYERDANGMDYNFIQNYQFRTFEGRQFCLNSFDFITNYVHKYPNPNDTRKAIAYFHTLRDINALKRNKTFTTYCNQNSIRVFEENLKYYYYIHHFKSFANHLPYYFGNLDVFIDNKEFLKVSNHFLTLERNLIIDSYFANLFKDYV